MNGIQERMIFDLKKMVLIEWMNNEESINKVACGEFEFSDLRILTVQWESQSSIVRGAKMDK